jgi:hypothetical protein
MELTGILDSTLRNMDKLKQKSAEIVKEQREMYYRSAAELNADYPCYSPILQAAVLGLYMARNYLAGNNC